MKAIEIPKTAQELVEKWLPDYDKRLLYFLGGDEENPVTITQFGKRAFCEQHLSEALFAFAEAVAREQREICQDIFDSHYKAEQVEYLYYDRQISTAPSPLEK